MTGDVGDGRRAGRWPACCYRRGNDCLVVLERQTDVPEESQRGVLRVESLERERGVLRVC